MFTPKKHLPRKQDVLHQYQEDLETWVKQTTHEKIRQQYAWLHASDGPHCARYEDSLPSDDHQPCCGRWDVEGVSLRSCAECREFSLAIWAVAMDERPDLKELYPRLNSGERAHG